METNITREDLENPQRFIGEGLGAPEAAILPAALQESAPYTTAVQKRLRWRSFYGIPNYQARLPNRGLEKPTMLGGLLHRRSVQPCRPCA